MEGLSFILIAVGALLTLFGRVQFGRGRLQFIEFLAFVTIAAVAIASSRDIFLGPVGDARRYHDAINACFASLPPCGTKLHEQVWSVPAAAIGAGWGLIYGFLIAYGMSLLARAANLTSRTWVLSALFLYSAYQVGNGMAEGSFFLFLLVGVIAAHGFRVNIAAAAFFAALIGHLGNAPFILYLLRFPRGWPVVTFTGALGLIFATLALDLRFDDIFSIVGKAEALISQEAAMSAVESKMRVSMRDAETSYAQSLLAIGFPYSTRGMAMAIWYYVVPLVTGGNAISLIVSALSTVIGLASLWLARSSPILLIIVVASIVLFGLTSFTPGIGLRHKVPLFLFLLMAIRPERLRDLAWRK